MLLLLNLLQNFTKVNTLEIHYELDDNSHSIDAVLQNKCEYEILALIKEVALRLDIEINLEVEPYGEGGFRNWLKVLKKDENKKATVTTAVLISILTVLLTTPIAKVSEKLIEKIFEDNELKQLEKDKLKLEIEKLEKEIGNNADSLQLSNLIRKRKSNFYETLAKYPKVTQVSFQIQNELKQSISKDKTITRNEFKNFVLVSDDLEPITNDEAIIEIVSPVLKKGNYKWVGIYNGETIQFNMQSNEFKTLVLNSNVEFKNGSSINCSLEIRKKIDNEGVERVVGYDVKRVNFYFENNKPIETKEGRKYRNDKLSNEQQLNLFGD